MQSPESLPQRLLQPCARDITVSDADHSIARGLEKCGACGIVAPPIRRVVNIALEFHDESLRDAIEVDDEAMQNVLAAELEAEYGAVAEERPCVPLSGCWMQPKQPREREPLGMCEPAQRIHPPTVAGQALPVITRTTHQRSVPPLPKGEGARG